MNQLDQNFWNKYGFKNNPYDTTALTLYADSLLPIAKAFVGRGQESREFQLMNNILSGKGGNRLVVEGEIGVGKTTFVNYHRYLWEKESKIPLFTPSGEITFLKGWSQREVLSEILSHLTTKLYLLYGKSLPKGNDLYQELLHLNKVLIEENHQWQLQICGSGGGRGKDKDVNLPKIPEAKLYHYFRDLVSAILKLGYGGIILHFDNLELMYQKALEETRDLFEEIRDLLQVPNVYFLFVGKTGFFNQIIGPLERVRSIFFSWPIHLKPLSKEEVLKVLHLRYDLLSSKGMKYIKPIEDELIFYLYDLYQGKIRFIMDAIYGILVNFPFPYAQTLPTSKGKELLKALTTEKIRTVLSQRELEVLLEMVQREEFTNTELAQALDIHKQNMAKYIKKLQDTGYIVFLRKEGRRAFYGVTKEILYLQKMQFKIMPLEFSPPSLPKNPLKERQIQFLSTTSRREKVTTARYAELSNISTPTALKDLKDLKERGYLKKQGARRGAYFEVIKSKIARKDR